MCMKKSGVDDSSVPDSTFVFFYMPKTKMTFLFFVDQKWLTNGAEKKSTLYLELMITLVSQKRKSCKLPLTLILAASRLCWEWKISLMRLSQPVMGRRKRLNCCLILKMRIWTQSNEP